METPRTGESEHAGPGTATRQVLATVARSGEPTFSIWQPDRSVSFGPQDTRHAGYERAVQAARSRGFVTRQRELGGRPVGMHEGCLALVYGMPPEGTIESRYVIVVDAVQRALSATGVHVEQTTVPASFCPGHYSLVGTGKLGGFAQRVRGDAAAVGGLIIEREHTALADVLSPVYDALELPFDPDTVGSLRRAGSNHSTAALRAELETQFSAVAESMNDKHADHCSR